MVYTCLAVVYTRLAVVYTRLAVVYGLYMPGYGLYMPGCGVYGHYWYKQYHVPVVVICAGQLNRPLIVSYVYRYISY